MKKFIIISFLFFSTGCSLFSPIKIQDDPDVIVLIPSDVPLKVTNGTIAPFNGLLISKSQFLDLRRGKETGFIKSINKYDMISIDGYLIHIDLLHKTEGIIRLKDEFTIKND